MKFVTFQNKHGENRAGILVNQKIIDVNQATNGNVPSQLLEIICKYDKYSSTLNELECNPTETLDLMDITFCSPIPNPPSVRDFYAFEQHVKNARKRRGLDVVPEWYELPAFYFSNHRAIIGHMDVVHRPGKSICLDYELEIACIIGKPGKNITAEEADNYIFGYCIMNDWSARDLQMQEMKIGLGPAKGKDFATSLGPFIVTKDELEVFKEGDKYNLSMKARVNDIELSNGNFSDIYYTFGEMIERASQDVMLFPGDIIGSGTVGTGCILELGTETHRWLEPGDKVELEITGLGRLINFIGQEDK